MHLTSLALDVPHRLIVDSPIGPLSLEASADGLVALSWTHLPLPTSPVPGVPAEIDRAHRFLCQGAAWLRAYLAGDLPLPPLPPLVPAGTTFQKAVWRQVVHIRPGTTTTYGAIARALCMPGASRAVGQAVGANPLPILIPCHRVLAAGGRLGGYSSGLRRKRWLLANEGLARISDGLSRNRGPAQIGHRAPVG
jgi:methylated-DNA-[protein]-cysteine S-methyltransferase